MKKLRLSILLVLASLAANAQFYKFSYETKTYQEFNDGKTVAPVLANQLTHYDFVQFNLFDTPTNITWSVGLNGFMTCTTDDFSFALDPCIIDLERRDANTSITEKTEMIDGELVQKVQWKNMGLTGHGPGDFINFQIWVYTTTQKVEFHYGPHRVTSEASFDGDSGPQIVVAQLTPDFSSVIEIYAVTGSGGNPVSLYNGFDYYTGVPDENLVMRFYNPTLSSVTNVNAQSLKMYPNPASDVLNIEGRYNGTESLTIVDALGNEVIKIDTIGESRSFNISELKAGVYFIKIEGIDTLHINKLVKSE